jgi:hypothetical protein
MRAVATSASSDLRMWFSIQTPRGGAVRVQKADVSAPGGVTSRLNGTPTKLRYAWRDPTVLLAAYHLHNRKTTCE